MEIDATKMLDLLTLETVMETCPKIAPPRPPVEGRQPPRLAIEANKLPTGGLIALMALLALILFGAAPAVYPLVGLTPGTYFSYLAYFAYFAYFYRRRSKRTAPRNSCLMIAFESYSA
jgi:hypothetical protein